MSTSTSSGPSSGSSSSGCMCGPDITEYVVEFFNAITGSATYQLLQKFLSNPNPGPVIVGLFVVSKVFGNGDAWDFKPYIVTPPPTTLMATVGNCPCSMSPCNLGITISGYCLDYRMPGNIIFGYVAGMLSISLGGMVFFADIVHVWDNNAPNTSDQVSAIQCGYSMYEDLDGSSVDPSALTTAIDDYVSSLSNLTSQCPPCAAPWAGAAPELT